MSGRSVRGGAPSLGRDEAERTLAVIHECLEEGIPYESPGGGERSARAEAARRLGITLPTLRNRIEVMAREHGLIPDLARFTAKVIAPMFSVDEIPGDGEPDAETLIAHLSARHRKRQAHHEAAKLRQVRVHLDGPIAVAFFGDPHVDDDGCAWADLERDVSICRDTEGMLACDVGDDSNNWVGRLAKLYAHQETSSRQALVLVEWLMLSLPWLLRIKGNHDTWNTDKGDPADYIHRLFNQLGVLEESGARLELHLPAGCSVKMHVRHDFPGGSQFNPAHALVKETLFGFRDHILACGHRHTSGYIPIWHNDPQRLCHGFRVGTYKDFDHYAKDKGFQHGNWARSMAAVIDPDYANDPVRYIRPCYSLEEAAEYLTWRRQKWSLGKTAAA